MDLLVTGPERGPILLLAHGAGAPMTSPFMEEFARWLAEHGVGTARFEFAYMASRRTEGKRRPPPRADSLLGEFEAALSAVSDRVILRNIFIGGKSMGGRVASMLADRAYARGRVKGLICLGYPFHPPDKPDKLRVEHLSTLACPALFVQGERDPFGNQAEVEALGLPASIEFHWAGDGDHDLGPRGGKGFTRRGNLAAAASAIAAWCGRVPDPMRAD